tara:strand:+ start:66 stop:296 length:231 start_codon:yes stop_codon:yes gene_type:complete
MSEKHIQVEGHPDLVRDRHSHAIINRNRSAYDNAKKRAQEAQQSRDEIRTATREINNIKSEMHEIKSLLKQLVSKE